MLQAQPWNTAFDTPLLASGAFSLAAQFIKSCPASNPALPVQAHPALAISDAAPAAGETVKLSFDASGGSGNSTGAYYVAWLAGLGVVYSDVGGSAAALSTTVPDDLEGTVYAAVVSSKEQAVSDATLVTGFVVVQFPFSASAAS